MSEDGEYERGYWDCYEDFKAKFDQIERDLDNLHLWAEANLRVLGLDKKNQTPHQSS